MKIRVKDLLKYDDGFCIGISFYSKPYVERCIKTDDSSVIEDILDFYYSSSEGLEVEYYDIYNHFEGRKQPYTVRKFREFVNKKNIPIDEKIILWEQDDCSMTTFEDILEFEDIDTKYIILI